MELNFAFDAKKVQRQIYGHFTFNIDSLKAFWCVFTILMFYHVLLFLSAILSPEFLSYFLVIFRF